MAKQNSTFNPTPVAVAKGGTGNTTATFSTGPLTVSTVGYRAPDGSVATPAYSFTSNTNSGILNSAGNISISSVGMNVATFQRSGSDSLLTITDGSSALSIKVSDGTTNATIGYTGATNAITLDNTGDVTLLNPLRITNGGTQANTKQVAIKNLMPTSTVNGTIAYYDGTNWVILAPPAAGTYFLKITSGGVGSGGTPFWSLV